MKLKQTLFIYNGKEMIVLSLLALFITAFAFTLGVHLGKRVNLKAAHGSGHVGPVELSEDHIDNPTDITEKDKKIWLLRTANETLHRELYEEVTKTGIQIDTPRQVEMPKDPKSASAGATTLKHLPSADPHAAQRSLANSSFYAVQLGAFPNSEDAKTAMSELEKHELKPILRKVDGSDGKTTFVLTVGRHSSEAAAKAEGQKLQDHHQIKSFVVTKFPN